MFRRHGPDVSRPAVQPDHLSEPLAPPRAGGGRPGALHLLSAAQGQLLRRHSALPLRRLRSRLQPAPPPPAPLQGPLPVGETLPGHHGEVRLRLAGEFQVRPAGVTGSRRKAFITLL